MTRLFGTVFQGARPQDIKGDQVVRTKTALLVGVTDYGGTKDLAFCEDDVNLMNEVLQLKGFTCTKLLNPKLHEEVLPTVEVLCQAQATSDDILLVYFSGHGGEALGEQFLQGPQQGSPASIDALLNRGDFLRLSEVLDTLSHSMALKIVLIDACRSVWNFDQAELANYYASVAKLRRDAYQHITNCVIVFASAEGTKSYGHDGKGSQFTKVLAKELRNYAQDFLQVVQLAITSLKESPNQQIPWIYSSTFTSTFPDRLYVNHEVRKPPFRDKTPKAFIGHRQGKLVGIARDNLVMFNSGAWESVLTLNKLGDALDVSFSTTAPSLAWLRGKSVYFSNTSGSNDKVRHVRATALDKVFGIKLAPNGAGIVAYGYANGDAKPGLCLWRIEAGMNAVKIQVQGLPNLQSNTCEWTKDGTIIVAFSFPDSGKTWLYKIAFLATGTLRAETVAQFDSRVTAMVVGDDDEVWLGHADGQVSRFELKSQTQTTIKRSHPLDPLASSCKKRWIGAGSDYLDRTLAVVGLAWDKQHKVLGVQFYDGSTSFVDGMAAVQIEAISAPAHTYKRAIAASGDGSFYTLGGLYGMVHHITLT